MDKETRKEIAVLKEKLEACEEFVSRTISLAIPFSIIGVIFFVASFFKDRLPQPGVLVVGPVLLLAVLLAQLYDIRRSTKDSFRLAGDQEDDAEDLDEDQEDNKERSNG